MAKIINYIGVGVDRTMYSVSVVMYRTMMCVCVKGGCSAVLAHGHVGQLPGDPQAQAPMLIYICCVRHVFFYV